MVRAVGEGEDVGGTTALRLINMYANLVLFVQI